MYCAISYIYKYIQLGNDIWWANRISNKNFFFFKKKKNYTQNVAEKLISGSFVKKNNIEHTFKSTAWIFINFFVCVCPSRGQPKNIKIKVPIICFTLYKAF